MERANKLTAYVESSESELSDMAASCLLESLSFAFLQNSLCQSPTPKFLVLEQRGGTHEISFRGLVAQRHHLDQVGDLVIHVCSVCVENLNNVVNPGDLKGITRPLTKLVDWTSILNLMYSS